MHNLAQVISAVAALLASTFWFWSALLHIPDLPDMELAGPRSPAGYMKRQSRWSAIAPAFAAVSAIAQSIGIFSN
jgi:hypothetical protein